ncbi:MAG TPA: FkbM family methyltransferase [Gemmatimonadaceae bacterium]
MHLGRYLRDPARIVHKLRWRLLYTGPRRDVTVDSYNGRLTFDSRDKLIGKYLYLDRAYERRYIESALAVLERDGFLARDGSGLVLDVGANIGMICIALVRHGWFGGAVAFEPAPGNARLLRHNVDQNGLRDRIRVVQAALSARPGELALELSEYNSGDNRIRVLDGRGAGGGGGGGAWNEDRRAVVRVPVRALDEALDDMGVDPSAVRLAWVDIQGHEGRFFEGARATIARGVPVVSEFWPYGILRSGMLRSEYVRVVEELFTHFYHLGDDGVEKRPIAEVDALFDAYRAPKQMCEVIFVRR